MEKYQHNIESLLERYNALSVCKNDILEAFNVLASSFENGHKLLIAGNGGSCADADHIVGELMKGFKKCRPLSDEDRKRLLDVDENNGAIIASKLQAGLPAIALHNHSGLNTAFMNDVENGGEYIYAQQVFNYGEEGDVFLGISTSGNAKNVFNAAVVAKSKGLKVICLSGKTGGKLKEIADVSIVVPENETFKIQEYHLPIYHCLCLMLEDYFYNE